MAKQSQKKGTHGKQAPIKSSLPLLPLLLSLVVSAAVGFGMYYWLNHSTSSEAKTKAQSTAEKAANTVDEHFNQLIKKSDLIEINPSAPLKHTYPIIIPSSGIPTDLNFSEQEYISRAQLDPARILPEVTLSKLPDPADSSKTINIQTLSFLKPLTSGQYLLIRWSLDPLKQKLQSITPPDIQIELNQENNNTNRVTALSINSKKEQALKPVPLKYNTWSVGATYNAPKQLLSPLYAGLATTGGLFFLSLSGLTLLSRRKTAIPEKVNSTASSLETNSEQQDINTPSTPEADKPELDTQTTEQANPHNAETADSDTTEALSNAKETADSQLTQTKTKDITTESDESTQPTSTLDTENNEPIFTEDELAEEMVFAEETPDSDQTSDQQQATDIDTDHQLLDSLENEIKSEHAKNSTMEFKAPVIPNVGELKIPTEPHTEQHADAAKELDDGNIINFESAAPASETISQENNKTQQKTSSTDTKISHVFRTFDIRGLASDLNETNVQRIAKGLARLFISKGQYHLVVGRDVRASSKRIATTLINTLVEQGLRVVDIDIVTTPLMVYAAKGSFGCGIMVTASHSPEDYNGFKWIINNDSPSTEQVLEVRDSVVTNTYAEPLGTGSVQTRSFHDQYIQTIQNDIMLADLPNVVIDTLHGATGKLAPTLIEDAGCMITTIHNNMDGKFSTGDPNPTQPGRLEILSKTVIKQGADVGFAFDCDGDRVAVVDEMGQVVTSEQLLCLFAKILLETNPAADIIYDIKCSRYVGNTITDLGGRPSLQPTGANILRAALKSSDQAVFAGELSGHFMFNDDRLGQYDDGIYAALRLLEWLTQTGVPLSVHLNSLPQVVSTDDIYIRTPSAEAASEQINTVVSHWKKTQEHTADDTENKINAVMTDIDGFRLDFPNGFGIIRSSNTSSAITVRFSADNDQKLSEIKAQFADFVKNINSELAEKITNI